MIVDAAATGLAVVVVGAAEAVGEAVGADDPAVGAVARVGDEVRAAIGRWLFVGGVELLAEFAEVGGELGVGGREIDVGAHELGVGFGEVGNGLGEPLHHRLFVGGGVGEVVHVAVELVHEVPGGRSSVGEADAVAG